MKKKMGKNMEKKIEKKRNKTKTGQVAFEFLTIYIVFISLFIAAVYIVSQRAAERRDFAEQMFAREVCSRFASEINIASRFNGYEKNYTFPKTLRGFVYNLSIYNGTLFMEYKTVNEVSFIYPLGAVNIWINKGVGSIPTHLGISPYDERLLINTSKGWMKINNKDGDITIIQ